MSTPIRPDAGAYNTERKMTLADFADKLDPIAIIGVGVVLLVGFVLYVRYFVKK
jgi:hypothetical protein